jgi:glucose 1-dehydrogenase
MSNTKVALVTGSSDGIGQATAKLLGENGYSVIVTYKSNKVKAKETLNHIKQHGGEGLIVQLDVTNEESVKNCFSVVEDKYSRLDVLVNNAGVDHPSSIENCSFETWKEITGPKIDGNFLCTKYALPLLKKAEKADVIVIMSSLDTIVDPQDPAYSVGTAGAVCFVKTMALALGKYGIRTNGVGPGSARTNLDYWQEAGLNKDETWEKFAKENPLGRVTTVEDVALTILDVLQNKSQFWNGNFIFVDGGNHIPHL